MDKFCSRDQAEEPYLGNAIVICDQALQQFSERPEDVVLWDGVRYCLTVTAIFGIPLRSPTLFLVAR
jgi:hypothetical protein